MKKKMLVKKRKTKKIKKIITIKTIFINSVIGGDFFEQIIILFILNVSFVCIHSYITNLIRKTFFINSDNAFNQYKMIDLER
jgi:hypothetical protein